MVRLDDETVGDRLEECKIDSYSVRVGVTLLAVMDKSGEGERGKETICDYLACERRSGFHRGLVSLFDLELTSSGIRYGMARIACKPSSLILSFLSESRPFPIAMCAHIATA